MNEKIRKTHVRNTHQKKRSGTKCSQHFVKQTFTVFNEMFFLIQKSGSVQSIARKYCRNHEIGVGNPRFIPTQLILNRLMIILKRVVNVNLFMCRCSYGSRTNMDKTKMEKHEMFKIQKKIGSLVEIQEIRIDVLNFSSETDDFFFFSDSLLF